MEKTNTWEKVRNNEILERGNFFISYNPSTGGQDGSSIFTELGNALGGNLKDGEETALVLRNYGADKTFLILEGDFRKEYEEVIAGGYEACLDVYKRNIDKRSNWSTEELPT